MTRGDDLRTLDIVEACASLAEVVHARGTVNEEILLRAAERLLEIIGEAATNCSSALKDRHPDVDWEGIAGLRVVLAHTTPGNTRTTGARPTTDGSSPGCGRCAG